MNRSRSAVLACLAFASLCAPRGVISTAAAQPCKPAWAEGFRTYDFGTMRAILPVQEDGQTVYYIGGQAIARWDGHEFSPLGDDGLGTFENVWTIERWDDGTGPAIYAGGEFSEGYGAPGRNIAKWDGTRWSPLGPGLNGIVRALQVWDDGTGPALYAAGFFTPDDGQPGRGIAKWDGKQWHALGTGLSGDGVGRALTVFNVGGREQLVVGGDFLDAGGAPVWDIAAWDGRKWSAFGPPIGDGPTDHTVIGFGLVDLGKGSEFYAVGKFGLTSNENIRNIARWNGRTWEAVGSGVGTAGYFLSSIARFDPGSGPLLVVGGNVTNAGISVWDGQTWVGWDVPINSVVRTVEPIDAPGGPELLVGGENICVRWDGSSIRSGLAPGGLTGSYQTGFQWSLARLPMADGARVFVAGNFHSAGDYVVNGCASYGADGWRPTGVITGDHIYYLATFNDGSGLALYGAGDFPSFDKKNKSRFAKWNGSAWEPVTTEAIKGPLFVHDDGLGPALYASTAAEPPIICRWDGAAWSKLPPLSNGEILDFATLDGTSGVSLVVAGSFQMVDGKHAGGIARWDGAAWHIFDEYLDARTVTALVVHDFGFGPMVCAASKEPSGAGGDMRRVLRWNGSKWTVLGGNFYPPQVDVSDLVMFNEGDVLTLYAIGHFEKVGQVEAQGLAKWTGKSWVAAFGGLKYGSGAEVAMPLESAYGKTLWLAGNFDEVEGVLGSHIARWDTCPSCLADFDKSDSLDIDDFIAFQAAFAAGDPRADFTGDGELDIDDFLAFGVAFGAGCP